MTLTPPDLATTTRIRAFMDHMDAYLRPLRARLAGEARRGR